MDKCPNILNIYKGDNNSPRDGTFNPVKKKLIYFLFHVIDLHKAAVGFFSSYFFCIKLAKEFT